MAPLEPGLEEEALVEVQQMEPQKADYARDMETEKLEEIVGLMIAERNLDLALGMMVGEA